jgi:hypothetical protein
VTRRREQELLDALGSVVEATVRLLELVGSGAALPPRRSRQSRTRRGPRRVAPASSSTSVATPAAAAAAAIAHVATVPRAGEQRQSEAARQRRVLNQWSRRGRGVGGAEELDPPPEGDDA